MFPSPCEIETRLRNLHPIISPLTRMLSLKSATGRYDSIVESGPVLNGNGLSTPIPWISYVQELVDHEIHAPENLSMDQSVAGNWMIVVPCGLLCAAEDSELAFFHELGTFLPQHPFMNCCQPPRIGAQTDLLARLDALLRIMALRLVHCTVAERRS